MKAEELNPKELKQAINDMICLHWKSEIMREYVWDLFKQYAVDFANHLSEIVSDGDDLYKFEEEYDNWLKEQEDEGVGVVTTILDALNGGRAPEFKK